MVSIHIDKKLFGDRLFAAVENEFMYVLVHCTMHPFGTKLQVFTANETQQKQTNDCKGGICFYEIEPLKESIV